MKTPMRLLLSLFILTLFSNLLVAQDGIYTVRLVEHEVDCDNMILYLDVEVKAESAASHFNIADQNYRISFNRTAFKPYDASLPEADRTIQISEELTLSEFVQEGSTGSFYNPHTLTGTIDTIISYNIELSGGDGYPLDELTWIPVGRISLEMLDETACGDIWIHPEAVFPSTFISEKLNSVLYPAEEGTFYAYNECFEPICVPNQGPAVLDDYINTFENIAATYDLLFNDSDPDGSLDPNSVTLISTPPASEATVTLGPNPGQITVTPAPGFSGDVTPFQYQVCDNEGTCSVGTIYVTVDDDPNTAIIDPALFSAIMLYPTLATEMVHLSFEEITAVAPVQFIMTDVNGRIINRETRAVNGSPVHSFDIGELAAGHYFFKMMIDDKVVVKRFVKL